MPHHYSHSAISLQVTSPSSASPSSPSWTFSGLTAPGYFKFLPNVMLQSITLGYTHTYTLTLLSQTTKYFISSLFHLHPAPHYGGGLQSSLYWVVALWDSGIQPGNRLTVSPDI